MWRLCVFKFIRNWRCNLTSLSWQQSNEITSMSYLNNRNSNTTDLANKQLQKIVFLRYPSIISKMTETSFYFEIHSTFKYPFESHQLARQMHTNQARQEEEKKNEHRILYDTWTGYLKNKTSSSVRISVWVCVGVWRVNQLMRVLLQLLSRE